MKKITSVRAVYFSPTDTTRQVAIFMAERMAKSMGVTYSTHDYTLPGGREAIFDFAEDELVIWATPVYAGRIPNKTLDYVKEALHGNQTPMIPVAVYGNRSVDHGLSELTGIMKDNGGIPIGGAAIVARHTFSDILAAGRPDASDYEQMEAFCQEMAGKLLDENADFTACNLIVPGEEHPERYYVPKMENGEPAKFLKAKPVVNEVACDGCGICEKVCPMGSNLVDNETKVSKTAGICIKCQACIRSCPKRARTFEDEAFLSHVRMVEQNFIERKEPAFFR